MPTANASDAREAARDVALVERLKRDDKTALREVFETHFPRLLHYAERVRSPNVAAEVEMKDLVYDVFAELRSKRKELAAGRLKVDLFGMLSQRIARERLEGPS